MLDGFVVGQYLPGNSPVHRLDPRTKILATMFIITGAIIARGFGFGPVAAAVLLAALLSGAPPGFLWRSLRMLWLILLFTFVLQVLFTPGEVMYRLGPFSITEEGLAAGGQMLLRLVLLVLASTLLTMTTTPINLTAGLERLARPLQRFGVPVHEMAMMMTIALRFVPTLLEEAHTIMRAQQSRGAGLSGAGYHKKFQALVSLMVPMFAGAFRRAEELATAMEARCYRGGAGRTTMKQLFFSSRDYLALVVSGATLVATVLLRVI